MQEQISNKNTFHLTPITKQTLQTRYSQLIKTISTQKKLCNEPKQTHKTQTKQTITQVMSKQTNKL